MNTRLLVLGYLTYGPMHGYEMQKHMETSRVETWADVLPGSIYHALKQMTKEGFVEITKTEQKGHRLRAIYAVTEAGRAEFQRLLREGLTLKPRSFPTSFFTTLSFLEALPPAEVQEAVTALIPRLEQELEEWNEGERLKHEYQPLPVHLRILFQNGREHVEADLSMLRHLQQALADKNQAQEQPGVSQTT